jgi:hypothetical protein
VHPGGPSQMGGRISPPARADWPLGGGASSGFSSGTSTTSSTSTSGAVIVTGIPWIGEENASSLYSSVRVASRPIDWIRAAAG